MLGFLKGKNKDKQNLKGDVQDQRKSTRKDDRQAENIASVKEQKSSRFSFKRTSGRSGQKKHSITSEEKEGVCCTSNSKSETFKDGILNSKLNPSVKAINTGGTELSIVITDTNPSSTIESKISNSLLTCNEDFAKRNIKYESADQLQSYLSANNSIIRFHHSSPVLSHPEGKRITYLATPSSSSSSLSSISSFSLYPSGRITPPAPRLGTCSRTSMSPMSLRKSNRSNIKTNPSFSAKKRSLLITDIHDKNKLNTTATKEIDGPSAYHLINGLPPLSPTFELKSSSQTCLKPSLPINCSSKANRVNPTISPPDSPSANVCRTRLSVSSMHSLESIPETHSCIENNDINYSQVKKYSRNAPQTGYSNNPKWNNKIPKYLPSYNPKSFSLKHPANISAPTAQANNSKSTSITMEPYSKNKFSITPKLKGHPSNQRLLISEQNNEFGKDKLKDNGEALSAFLTTRNSTESPSQHRRNTETLMHKTDIISTSNTDPTEASHQDINPVSINISEEKGAEKSSDIQQPLSTVNNHTKTYANTSQIEMLTGSLGDMERRSLSPSRTMPKVRLSDAIQVSRANSAPKERAKNCSIPILRDRDQIALKNSQKKTYTSSCSKNRETNSSQSRNPVMKEVETQATRYQHQIDQLTVKLTKEQQIVFQLRQDLEDAQKAAKLHKQELDETKKQNSSMTSLEIRIQDLSRQLREKEAITESVRVDLQYEKSESVACKAKMKKLEEDLSNSEKNVQKLERQSANKNQDSGKVGDLELKIKSLEEKLIQSESTRRNHETTLAEIEEEREDEMKIVQDALDEAAREREELIKTFNKELDHANTMNTAREQQMLDDFEWKLREMQKENKETLDEMEKQAENTIQKKKPNEDDEYKLKLEKAKKEINSEWEDRHRQECARLKVCLESKYEQERETAVTDLRSQKEQEHQAIKMAHETKEKETAKEMANLRQLLKDKEANHQMETENNRTCSDRDICELRMKLQRLSDSSYDKEQNMIEKHSEELERLRIDYNERIKEMHARIEDYEARIGIDTIAKMNEEHGKQMEHLREQHMISMERLREESESDKFQCVEEARLALTNHYEQLSTSFREKLSESDIQISQYKNELQIATELANKRKETMQDYQGQLERLKQIQSLGSSLPAVTSGSSGLITEFSLESQSYNGSQDSHTSQDTGSSSDSGHEDSHKNGGGSLLGKVFGGGWFQSQKTRRGSMPLTNKKAY